MSKKWLGIALVLLCASPAAFARPQYGLVGAWDFENGYTDVSGVAPLYTGTAAGSVSITTDPSRGKVATFPASGRVSFGPSSGGKLDIPDVVSFACWVKVNVASTTGKTWLPICGKGPGGYRLFLHGEQPNGESYLFPMFQYGLTGGLAWPTVILHTGDTNGWLHVGCSYDGDFNRIYVNGVLSGMLAAELPCEGFDTLEGWKRDLWSGTACPYYFSIGGLAGYGIFFQGSLDDVAIWRGVLDAQDFTDLYTSSKTIHQILPKPPYAQFAWDESLIAAYSFEGNTAELSPGPAADGILMNSATLVSDPEQGNVLYGDPNNPYYVDCGLADKFDNVGMGTDPNEGFTMTAWIKPDAVNPDAWAMLAAKGGSGYRMFYHSIDPSTGGRTLGGMVDAGDTPTDESMGNGGSMQPGQWYHVAIVYNPNYPPGYDPADPDTWDNPESSYPVGDPRRGPGRLRGFVDGLAAFGHPDEDISPNHLRGPLLDTSADPLTIKANFGENFAGKIDDVRVYNRPLNQLEIRWLMEQKCAAQTIGRDYTGDCAVNLEDFAVLASEWLNRYDLINFARMTELWSESDIFWP